jgi:hypothetical protein
MMSTPITEKTGKIGEIRNLQCQLRQWQLLLPRQAEIGGTREGVMKESVADLQEIENIEMIEDTTQGQAIESAGAEAGIIDEVEMIETTEGETTLAQGEKREGAIMREAGQEVEMKKGGERRMFLLLTHRNLMNLVSVGKPAKKEGP